MLYDRRRELDQKGLEMHRAADFLLARGLCKRRLWEDDGRVCTMGAFRLWQDGATLQSEADPEYVRRLASYLGISGSSDYSVRYQIVQWNDASERTIDDVVHAMREAAYLKDEALSPAA